MQNRYYHDNDEQKSLKSVKTNFAASRPAIENPETEVTKLQNYESCKVTEVTKLWKLQRYGSCEAAFQVKLCHSSCQVICITVLVWRMHMKWTTIWHSPMSYIPGRDIPRAHAPVFQNGCHMERSKAVSF